MYRRRIRHCICLIVDLVIIDRLMLETSIGSFTFQTLGVWDFFLIWIDDIIKALKNDF